MTIPAVHKTATLINSNILHSLCRHVRFAAGDVLRQKGQHYTDMYLIADGTVDVYLDGDRRAKPPIVREAGSPIGEIGFLRGCSATATVTARTPTETLIIDDSTLARLESEQPALTAQLLQFLAKTAEERTSLNLTFTPTARTRDRIVEVHLCRNADMLEGAQRMRYEVYCQELKRNSPYANHEKKIISDLLDDAGHTFIAVEAGETIGTIRGNRPSEGSIGVLEELYGMRRSVHHPHGTIICTKFIVKRSKRRSPAAMMLLAAMARYVLRNNIKECYIDCIPALVPYYKAVGFRICGPQFFHRENGPSHPMVLDDNAAMRRTGDYKARRHFQFYLKAKFIKWIDRWRNIETLASPS